VPTDCVAVCTAAEPHPAVTMPAPATAARLPRNSRRVSVLSGTGDFLLKKQADIHR
jgi:hypothetical protein